MGTWEEMCYGYLPYKPKLNLDYSVHVTNSVPDKIGNLIVDKVNKKYGIDGGRMNGKVKAQNDYLTRCALFTKESLTVKKIIHSGRCTIVIWGDGEKTIVKQSEDDDWDEYAAFCAAFCKRVFGSTSAVKRLIKKKTVPNKKDKIITVKSPSFSNAATITAYSRTPEQIEKEMAELAKRLVAMEKTK